MNYWEPICPTPFEIFVLEGRSEKKAKWMKLGASFFREEMEAIAREFKETGRTSRVRKYIPHDHKRGPR